MKAILDCRNSLPELFSFKCYGFFSIETCKHRCTNIYNWSNAMADNVFPTKNLNKNTLTLLKKRNILF